MGIDAKDIQVFMYRILRFSMNTCYTFVQKHPLVSGVLIISFLLYLFLPSVFYFLIYSSPILVCIAVYIRFYLNSKCPKIQNPIKDEKKDHGALSSLKSKSLADDHVVNNKPSMRSQRSVRRNVGERYKEWGAHGGKEENDMVMSKTPNDDLIGRARQIEEKPKGVIGEKESYSLDHGESSSCNVSAAENIQALDEDRPILVSEPSMPDLISCDGSNEQPEKFSGGVGEVDVESEAEDEDEEEAQEYRNKAVEWTEDDQKNLMDLGDSEIERNKRLESLIAKRRARKLFKMQVEKSLIDLDSVPPSQIAPIFIAKGNPFEFPNNSDAVDRLQMPGSAPSILLPDRNPFDLPYGPHEEKPNLMADSFQQEFAAAQQKDMLFCRHESFCRGPSFPLEPKQDRNDSNFGPYFGIENRAVQRPQYSRFRRQSDEGDLDQLAEASSQESEPIYDIEHAPDVVKQGGQAQNVMNSTKIKHDEDRKTENSMIEIKGEGMGNASDVKSRSDNGSEGQMETDSIKDNNSESSSSSYLENGGQFFNEKRVEVSENVQPRVVIFPQELSKLLSPIPKSLAVSETSYDFSPTANDETKMEERSFYTGKGVCHTSTYSIASDMQVEVSEISSPPMTVDGTVSSPDGESLTYDGDIEKELTSGSEEMWEASFYSRPREINEVSEDNSTERGFSGFNKKPEDPITSSMLSEQVAQQDLNNSISSSSRTEIPEMVQAHSVDFENISNDVKQVVAEVGEHRSFNSSDALSPSNPENTMQLTGDSMAHPPHEVYSENPEESSNHPEKSAEEVKVILDVDDPVVHANGDMEDLNSMENRDGGSQILIKQGDLSKPAEEIDVNSSEYIEGNSEQPAENQAISESKKPMEENKNSYFIEGFKGDTEKPTENEDVEDVSKPIQGEDNLKSIPDSKDDQNIAEVGVSGINQSSDYPVASSVHPELMVEQVPVISSSFLTGVSGVNQSSDDPVASSVQPELMVEQVPIISSSASSPRSVLQLHRFPSDQISLNFDQQRDIDVPQTGVEDTLRNNQSDEQTPQNLSPTTHQNAQYLVEDSLNYPANNSNSEKLEEPSNTLGKSTEEVNIIYNMSKPLFDDKKGEEDLSTKPSEGESKISHEAALELSKQAEESNPRSLEHSKAENLMGYAASIGQSKPEEENADLDVPETMVKDEASTSYPGKVTKEGSIINRINIDPVVSEKEDEKSSKSVQGSGGESQFSIRHEAIVEPQKPAEVTVSPVKEYIENGHSGQLTEDEAIIAPPKLIEENESSSTTKNHEEFGELVEHKDINHPPKSADAEGNSEAILDVKGESENLMDHEAVVILSNPAVAINQIDIPGTVVAGKEPSKPLPQKSIAEVDITHSVNGAVANEMTDEKNYVGDSEGEPQTFNRQDAIVEPSKTAETTTSRSIKDIEGETKKLIEDEAKVSPSGLARVSNSSNDMKNSEEPGMLIDQENVTDPPEPGRGNDSLKAIEDITGELKDLVQDDNGTDKFTNHEMVVEPSKPIESQVKPTNPEANNSHAEAA